MDHDEILIDRLGIDVPPKISLRRELDGKSYLETLRFSAAEGYPGYFPLGVRFCPNFTVNHVVDWALKKIESLLTRVLDLSTVENGQLDTIRLCESNGLKERYNALSHCWGGLEISAKTTRSTVEGRIKKGILINELPPLFQQALAVGRRLGIFRLWIDALCIIQDDAHDWEVEAALIANVYSGSFLTLTATRANNSTEGMLGERSIMKADGTRQLMEYYHIKTQNAPSIVAHHDAKISKY